MVIFYSKLVNYYQINLQRTPKSDYKWDGEFQNESAKKWEKGVHFQIIITTFDESVLSIIIKHYNYGQKAIWAFSKPIYLLCN